MTNYGTAEKWKTQIKKRIELPMDDKSSTQSQSFHFNQHYHPMIVLNPTNGFNPTLVLFMFIVADLCLLSSHKSEIQSVHSCISFLLQSHVLAWCIVSRFVPRPAGQPSPADVDLVQTPEEGSGSTCGNWSALPGCLPPDDGSTPG